MEEITIVMAVFQPNFAFLKNQIASISAQTHANTHVIFVEADCKSRSRINSFATTSNLSFDICAPKNRLDAVRAFEFGITRALELRPDSTYFALCDQDDIWHSTKLACCLTRLQTTGVVLVHTDARLVDASGTLLHSSLFKSEQRRKNPGLRGLLYRNTITGMTTLMRRNVVEAALPFPPQDGIHFFHDLWLGLVAHCLGSVSFIDEALVDYRQHSSNAVGAVTREPRRHNSLPSKLRNAAATHGRARFLATTLRDRFSTAKTAQRQIRALSPFWRTRLLGQHFLADATILFVTGRPSLAKAAFANFMVAFGRPLWAMIQTPKIGFQPALDQFDERMFRLSPGARPANIAHAVSSPPSKPAVAWWTYFDPRMSARWTPSFTADRVSINVLIPSLNPSEIFAGIATAIDFGLNLAQQGHPIRFIATDLPIAATSASRAFILGRAPARFDASLITLHSGVEEISIPAHREDRFLATAWWTAHLANQIITQNDLSHRAFFYLIQDYEPGFYPWGTEHAGALSSYNLPYIPIFNTTLLARYFMELGIGPQSSTIAFRPSIDIESFANLTRTKRQGPRKLAIYGRPEVARNLFHMTIEALGNFIQAEDLTARDIDLVSVGLKHTDVLLPNALVLKSLGKVPWNGYPSFLTTVDLGLSLMMSPHPSHLPLEMAAAGARVVTNSFGPKNLSEFSSLIKSAALSADELTTALRVSWNAPPATPQQRHIDLTTMGLTLPQAALLVSQAHLDPQKEARTA